MNRLYPLITLVLLTLFSACDEKKTGETTTQTNEAIADATTHFLEYNGIKIKLPQTFKKSSLYEYQKLISSEMTKEELETENFRLDELAGMEGELYLFYDTENKTSISVQASPHMAFEKSDAQQLLNSIAINNQKLPNANKLNIEKIAAKFNGNKLQQIFKAVYKFEVKKTKETWYKTNYILSSNKKTLFIEVSESELTDYDSYIENIVF